MRQWNDLTETERNQYINKAHSYWDNHADHVNKLIDNASHVVAPSGSDMSRPELWKDSHWLWFWTYYSE